jgi:hypothetical protein
MANKRRRQQQRSSEVGTQVPAENATAEVVPSYHKDYERQAVRAGNFRAYTSVEDAINGARRSWETHVPHAVAFAEYQFGLLTLKDHILEGLPRQLDKLRGRPNCKESAAARAAIQIKAGGLNYTKWCEPAIKSGIGANAFRGLGNLSVFATRHNCIDVLIQKTNCLEILGFLYNSVVHPAKRCELLQFLGMSREDAMRSLEENGAPSRLSDLV